MYLVSEALRLMQKSHVEISATDLKTLANYKRHVDYPTKFIPTWVKVRVALALGLGTMIGWKRIVITVGEKIGKDHLTYGQGAAAEITAMATIGAADYFGLPVSTTHVLSSGVAGTMWANKSGLQWATVRNLIMAWVLTLPISIMLSARSGIFLRNQTTQKPDPPRRHKVVLRAGCFRTTCDRGFDHREFRRRVGIFPAVRREASADNILLIAI
jgi:PiT family inorganic phosphate transporter